MNLKNLNDQILLRRTSDLALREREFTLEILHHLKEIERRRLFSTLGCSSLFVYCTEKLGYSEGSAQRRIQAMRALRDLPEIESKIESGALTLSNLAKAQTLFSHQKKSGNAYSPAEKLRVLGELEDKSACEADRVIAHENPSLCHQEKVRVLAGDKNELRAIVDDEFLELLETLKGRLAHKLPGASTSEILKYALQAALNQLDRQNQKSQKDEKTQKNQKNLTNESNDQNQQNENNESNRQRELNQFNMRRRDFQPDISDLPPTSAVKQKGVSSKSVSAVSRREVWWRAENKCENCGSRYALEVDHRNPLAFGGSHESDNLRLLCRPCNQRAAIEKLGLKKMNSYLNRSDGPRGWASTIQSQIGKISKLEFRF